MNQSERRNYLIRALLKENPQYAGMQIPAQSDDQKVLLRSLMNIRMPKAADPVFLEIQDAYLSEENAQKGVVTLADIGQVLEQLKK